MSTDRNDSPSIGELIGELSRQLSRLIRGEIALIRLEIANAVGQLGTVTAMFLAAGLFALCGILFFLMMLHSFFVQLVGRWLGELIVTAIMFLIAGAIAWVGAKRLDKWKVKGGGSDSRAVEPDESADSTPQPEGNSNVR